MEREFVGVRFGVDGRFEGTRGESELLRRGGEIGGRLGRGSVGEELKVRVSRLQSSPMVDPVRMR